MVTQLDIPTKFFPRCCFTGLCILVAKNGALILNINGSNRSSDGIVVDSVPSCLLFNHEGIHQLFMPPKIVPFASEFCRSLADGEAPRIQRDRDH